MVALSPTVKAALLLDSRRAAASLNRWSIRDLLDFNLNAKNTKSLLQEVRVRLAVQHSRLSELSRSIEEYARVATVEGGKARRDLKSLNQLHENTYLLLHRITDGDGRALLENYTVRSKKYVADMLDQIMARHANSVETLADAVIHARNIEGGLPRVLMRQFLSDVNLLRNKPVVSFLHSRLMIQLLCDHYISLTKGKKTGAVSLEADVLDMVDDAVTEARHVCDANLGLAPEVHIEPDASITYDFSPPPLIRSWLHHAIVEVAKNAMSSNVQQHLQHPSDAIPPFVLIRIDKEIACESSSPKYLRIRVIDQGTGLKDEARAFGFARSTAPKRWDRLDEQQSYAAVRQPLGSLGVGLPLSRLMLQVFGGDMVLCNHGKGISINNGCTATLKISYDDNFIAKN